MRRYADEDEEAIRTASYVRDWKASGLIDAERAAAIEADLRTGLKRTHWALRAILFVFSISVIQSALGFFFVVLMPDEASVTAVLVLLAGIACVVIAELLVARYGFYRFGIEEASVVCAIGLVAAGVTLLASTAGARDETLALIAFFTIAVAGAAAYLRFGLLYCAIAAIGAAAAAPFFFDVSEMSSRLFAAIVLLTIHSIAGTMQKPSDQDYPGDDYAVIESIAWLGLYLVLNLELLPRSLGLRQDVTAQFYWATYSVIWALPVVGLYRGIRRKHRWMIQANLVMALATLVTNKLYLGWPRHTWDPILLGVFLIGVALLVRRWLTMGPDAQRHGFTARRFVVSDETSVAQVAMATMALKPESTIHGTSNADTFQPGGGGRSGGAGAGGSF